MKPMKIYTVLCVMDGTREVFAPLMAAPDGQQAAKDVATIFQGYAKLQIVGAIEGAHDVECPQRPTHSSRASELFPVTKP